MAHYPETSLTQRSIAQIIHRDLFRKCLFTQHAVAHYC